MIIGAIITCEVLFWVFLAVGLVSRYLLRLRAASTAILLGLPLIDLALLVFTSIDLARGTPPGSEHSIAAYYIGFTVGFGHPLVKWADARFAHRFAGGPAPVKPAKGSGAYVRSLWTEWFRVVLAAAVAAVALVIMGLIANRGAIPAGWEEFESNPMFGSIMPMWGLVLIWFLAGPAFAKRTDAQPASTQTG